MNSSESDIYQVIINNQLAKGRTLDEVIHNLSQLLNQTPEKIRHILSTPSFIVKSAATLEKARLIQAKIIKTGVGCQIKKIYQTDTVDVSTLAQDTQIICAKCGHQQAVNSNCAHCGIVFYKFAQNKGNSHLSVKPNPVNSNKKQPLKRSRKPQVQSNNTPRNIFISIFIILMLVFAVSALNKTGQKNKHPIVLDNDQELYAIETHTIANTDDYEDLIVPGYITIIDFTADWCPVCKRLNQFEEKLVDIREDVIVRKIDVTNSKDYQLALKKYQLNFRGVPHSIIYGKKGEFIADDSTRQREGQRYIHSLIE